MGHYDVLSRLARDYGYDIIVLTFNHEGNSRAVSEKVGGMTVHRLGCWVPEHFVTIPKPTWGNLRLIIRVMRLHYNLVYTRTRYSPSTLIGACAAFAKKVPLLHTEVATTPLKSGRRLYDRIGWIMDNTLGRYIARVAVCVSVSKAAESMTQKLGAEHTVVIYNGIDKGLFFPPVERTVGRKPVVLFVGRLVWLKGIDVLNVLADRLDGTVDIRAVGEGNGYRHPQITYTGELSHAEVSEEMRKADIFLLPSRMEGLPRVVQEAMACGLPVVTTDVGGTRELVQHLESGYLCPVNDRMVDVMENWVRTLVEMPSQREAMGTAGIERAKQFSWDRTVREYDRVMRLVARQPALRFRGLLRLLLDPPNAVDTWQRAVVKSLLWRVIGLVLLGGIAYGITGSWGHTAVITLAFHGIRVAMYIVFERCWEHVGWGRKSNKKGARERRKRHEVCRQG